VDASVDILLHRTSLQGFDPLRRPAGGTRSVPIRSATPTARAVGDGFDRKLVSAAKFFPNSGPIATDVAALFLA
jgi:hypothetical protein